MDFENVKNIELSILVENVAPFVDGISTSQAQSYTIKISVNNLPEDPAFVPETKVVPVSEDPSDSPKDGVITTYAAVDPDTGEPSEDVK